MAKPRKMKECVVCKMQFDPIECKRIFGKYFVETNPSVCSSGCYTKDILKNAKP